MPVVTGTAVAGAVAVTKGSAIWGGIKAAALAIGKFLGTYGSKIASGAAVTAVALSGGSSRDGNVSATFNKPLIGNKSTSDSKSAAGTQKRELSKKDKKIYDYSRSYAEHMGVKYGLSKKQVKQNTWKHYARAKNDSEFRKFLNRNYGSK